MSDSDSPGRSGPAHSGAADESTTTPISRLMGVETTLKQLWESRGTEMDAVGEMLSSPITEGNAEKWIPQLGERIAALGGHLKLVAIFPDQRVTLLREPGPEESTQPRASTIDLP